MRFKNPFAALSPLPIVLAVAGTMIANHLPNERFDLVEYAMPHYQVSAIQPTNIWSSLSNVTVSGKVKTADGRPIKGASVVIRDAETNAVIRTALSSPFGYYRLDQIETGRLYALSVSHKRYIFALPAHLLEINEDRTGVDFTGEVNE
jgi:hypothetical protein